MTQFGLAQNTKWRSLIEVLEVSDLVDWKFSTCPDYLALEQQEAYAILCKRCFAQFWKPRCFLLTPLMKLKAGPYRLRVWMKCLRSKEALIALISERTQHFFKGWCKNSTPLLKLNKAVANVSKVLHLPIPFHILCCWQSVNFIKVLPYHCFIPH